jgi:aldose 1-epimerase
MSVASEPQIVILSDTQASLEATFVPGAGMLCCSLRHRGEELLAQNAGVAAYAQRGKTLGIPLLYPWANRLAGFDYSVAGRTVAVPRDTARVALDANGLPIHGLIGGRLAWELDEAFESGSQRAGGAPEPGTPTPAVSPKPGAATLLARLRFDDTQPELFEVFPFRHELTYRAALADGRLLIELTVHACGADPVPVAFGFHPYLAPAGGAPRERWQVQLPALRRLALDEHQIPTGPGDSQPSQTFALDGHAFDDGFDSVAQPARFAVADGRRRLELELLAGYGCAQVYAPLGRSFICFEPMTAPANALRSGSGLHVLAPGASYRAAFALSVRDARAP